MSNNAPALILNQESLKIHFTRHSSISEDITKPPLLDPKILASLSSKRRLHHVSGRSALSKISSSKDGDVLEIVPGLGGCLIRDGRIFARCSISHSDYGAVAVVAPENMSVGVDLEPRNRIISQGALNLILNEKEKYDAQDEHSRLLIWMSKEAISKALGIGMSISKDITHDGKSWVAMGSRWATNSHHVKISGVEHIAVIALGITEEI